MTWISRTTLESSRRSCALRAMSFRGVTPLDNDLYMVHFANGTAEWRIGLVKERTIGRIALGPQY